MQIVLNLLQRKTRFSFLPCWSLTNAINVIMVPKYLYMLMEFLTRSCCFLLIFDDHFSDIWIIGFDHFILGMDKNYEFFYKIDNVVLISLSKPLLDSSSPRHTHVYESSVTVKISTICIYWLIIKQLPPSDKQITSRFTLQKKRKRKWEKRSTNLSTAISWNRFYNWL